MERDWVGSDLTVRIPRLMSSTSTPKATRASQKRITHFRATRATKMAVEVEDVAQITFQAMVAGQPVLLTEEQIAMTTDLYKHDYGQ